MPSNLHFSPYESLGVPSRPMSINHLRRLSPNDLPRLRQFWIDYWGSEEMITRGKIHRSEQLEGFILEDGDEWVGLLTFVIENGECEVISLNSLRQGRGIGSKLIEQAIQEARARGSQ